ncbi:MAG: glycosyltransferase family 4 protein [Saprospiraceae bacterium]|nr:glycosyltransferase family 4 protein [Saprospiraceae bacterium]
MRILFVLEHFYPYIGGAEHLFWELSRALIEKEHQVTVVTTRFRPDLPSTEMIDGVKVIRVDCRNRYLFSFLSFPKVLEEAGKADLVQTTSYNAAFPAFFAAKFRRKPVVVTFHEVWAGLWWRLPQTPLWLKGAYWMWEQLLLRLPFDRFIAVSNATAQALRHSGISSTRISMIYNGLDYHKFLGYKHQPPSEFTVTYFGRLGTSKGLDLLLPAMARFLEDHPEAQFKLIIPQVPEALYRWVMGQVNRWPSKDRVMLYHDLPQQDLYNEVATSTCIVVPSYSEGFCFVAAEAVGLGVPIISSERTALKEVVGGKMVGIDSLTIDGVSQALQQAWNNQWEEKPIREFPLSESVRQYQALLLELLSLRKEKPLTHQ